MNKEFQSEKPKVHLLYDRIFTTFRLILKNFIKQEVLEKFPVDSIDLSNPNNYVDETHLYLGVNVKLLIEASKKTFSISEESSFRKNCLSFYVALANDIRARFNFKDATLKFIRAFNPDKALSGEIADVMPVLNIISSFNLDAEAVNNEWRLISVTPSLQAFANFEIEKFWFEVGNYKERDELQFPNISFLAKSILSLPQSSANVERIFSQHNLNKTSIRNRLTIKTSNAILSAKDLLNTECYKWTPPKEMLTYNINSDDDDDNDL